LCADKLDSHLEKNHIIDEMSWAKRFVETLEAASLIIVDKPCERATTLCKALNPNAELQSLGSMRPLAQRPKPLQTAWSALLNEEKLPGLPGVERFLFSARRPFDRERLSAWLREPLAGLVRVRGFFWVADCPQVVAQLSIAGSHRSWEPVGTWWIGIRRSHWPEDPAQLARIQAQWHPDFGDRLQALGCIGIDCDTTLLRESLESCLLSQAELGAHWRNIAMVPNPFPG
jgi:G3E family GTPase